MDSARTNCVYSWGNACLVIVWRVHICSSGCRYTCERNASLPETIILSSYTRAVSHTHKRTVIHDVVIVNRNVKWTNKKDGFKITATYLHEVHFPWPSFGGLSGGWSQNMAMCPFACYFVFTNIKWTSAPLHFSCAQNFLQFVILSIYQLWFCVFVWHHMIINKNKKPITFFFLLNPWHIYWLIIVYLLNCTLVSSIWL